MTPPSDRDRPDPSIVARARGHASHAGGSDMLDPVLEVFGLSVTWRLRTARETTASVPDAPVGLANHAATDAPDAGIAVDDHAAGDVVALPVPGRDEVLADHVRVPDVIDAVSHPMASDGSTLATLGFEDLRARAQVCQACRLCETRKKVVFGVGDPRADWLFVGEGPGANEDEQGEPFVGQAGKLLDNMLRALGLQRDNNVFIANVVKCRPPGNRDPLPDEIAACEGYLQRQIALIQPKVIVALGRFAAQALLRSDATIGALRRINAAEHRGGPAESGNAIAPQRVHHYEGVPVVVTYHPAYLLRTPSDKAKVWEDLCRARDVFSR